MLYKDHADSAVFLSRPDAAVKTDDWGFFCLRNIQDTVYRMYAVWDENNNNKYDPESEKIANLLQKTLIDALDPGSNRKCKKASGIYLMQNIGRTGVLVECGFLSNPKEEAKLRSADYQKKLCCVLATGISSYVNTG